MFGSVSAPNSGCENTYFEPAAPPSTRDQNLSEGFSSQGSHSSNLSTHAIGTTLLSCVLPIEITTKNEYETNILYKVEK